MNPLNPIMAVLVIASVGALPLRTLADDGAKTSPVSTESHPVNALAKILAANPQARGDAGKRISDFLLKPDADGKSFVAAETDGIALGDVVQKWATTESQAGKVAMLYFVVGPGETVPAWALKDGLLARSFVPNNKWEPKLRKSLVDWTAKDQITPGREKSAATGFLNNAVDEATKVFNDARSKKELDLSIEGNNNTGVSVPGSGLSGTTLGNGSTRDYDINDLFKGGAVWGSVTGPKDEGSRTISLKIYTKRIPNDDGTFTVVNELGIFDITNSVDIYGQRFPLDSGDKTFVLDDRTDGHKKYELKFGMPDEKGNRTISFGRPDGTPLTTSVNELLLARADQAAAMGNIVKIGGVDHYVLPQGGARSAYDFFPKDVIDGRGDGRDPNSLVPSLYAEVGKRGPNGYVQRLPPGANGGPHLGTVGDKDYHLEWNKNIPPSGAWEVKEGKGDLPQPPPKPTTTDPNNPGGGTTDPNNPGGGTTPTTGGEKTIAELTSLLMATGKCSVNPDDTKDLADNLKGKYGIVTCENPVDGKQQIILVPKSATTPDQQMAFGNVDGLKLLRARFTGHYLVLQFDKQIQYLDLLKPNKSGFELSGFVVMPDKNASKFNDVTIFVDAMRNYLGVSGAAITEVPRRLTKAVGNKQYELTGAFPKDVFTVNVKSNGDTFNIWPTYKGPGDAPAPDTQPYAGVSGPTNAMDGAVSSVDEKFPAEFETADKRKAKSVKITSDIALYESEDPIAKDGPKEKKYYLMFKYNSPDPTENKIFRQKPFEAFNATNPLPANYQMQGLLTTGAAVKDRVASGYGYVSGSTKEKGSLAVFQNKQVDGTNAKDAKANCVGPIVWWGSDRAEAQAACEAGKY